MRFDILLGGMMVSLCLLACSCSNRAGQSAGPRLPPLKASDIRKCVMLYAGERVQLPEKEAREVWLVVEAVMSRKDLRPVEPPKHFFFNSRQLQFYTDATSLKPASVFLVSYSPISTTEPEHGICLAGDEVYAVKKEALKELLDKLRTCYDTYREREEAERKGAEDQKGRK